MMAVATSHTSSNPITSNQPHLTLPNHHKHNHQSNHTHLNHVPSNVHSTLANNQNASTAAATSARATTPLKDPTHMNYLSSSQSAPSDPSLPNPLHSLAQVDVFSSFLGEEIVSNWRRGLELPPPPPHLGGVVANLRTSMQSMQLNHQLCSPINADELSSHHLSHHSQQQQQQQHNHQQQQQMLHHHHQQQQTAAALRQQQQQMVLHQQQLDDKSSHNDACSSTASTPVLQDSRCGAGGGGDDHLNGSATPMSLARRSKSPEDNNNHLGSLPHGPPANFPIGLPFQFQERSHFRFADQELPGMPPGSMVGRLGDSLIPKGDPMEAKLQEMLRYNMDKYANQNLDTMHISRRVRELLSVHNIGQRLFAKYVLGLSQGTVSELLSKPKPWDKLTEKGRDSYRKMHAWSCDDNAVMLLKSLIPKKGKCQNLISPTPETTHI